MGQIELPYEKLKREMINEIQKHEWVDLATSEGNFVTTRRMRLVSSGLTLWCFTDVNSRKVTQILANPNVAANVGFVQIEGEAKVKGHPLDEENADFIKTYRETQPKNYETSTTGQISRRRPNARVIEISPRRIALWKTSLFEPEPAPGLYILMVEKKKAYRITDLAFKESPAYTE